MEIIKLISLAVNGVACNAPRGYRQIIVNGEVTLGKMGNRRERCPANCCAPASNLPRGGRINSSSPASGCSSPLPQVRGSCLEVDLYERAAGKSRQRPFAPAADGRRSGRRRCDGTSQPSYVFPPPAMASGSSIQGGGRVPLRVAPAALCMKSAGAETPSQAPAPPPPFTLNRAPKSATPRIHGLSAPRRVVDGLQSRSRPECRLIPFLTMPPLRRDHPGWPGSTPSNAGPSAATTTSISHSAIRRYSPPPIGSDSRSAI